MASRVSVIIPTYNRAELLKAAIQSVLAQTYPNYELIVVDDGSVDSTPEMLRQIDDSRVHLIRQENAGRSAARNRGVAFSSGEYLAFLDDDDEFMPHKLAHQASFLEARPKVGLVAGGHQYVDGQGNPLQLAEPWKGKEALDCKEWLKGCPFLLQSILLRRQWWDAVGGLDPTLPQAHDHDFFLRLAAQNCVMKWIHEPVFRYRMHPDNVSRSAYTQTQCRIRMLEKFFASEIAPSWARDSKSQWVGYHWALGAVHACAVGQTEEAKLSLCEAIKHDPQLLDDRSDVLIDHVIGFSHSPMHSWSPGQFVHLVFDNLAEELTNARSLRRIAMARLAMRQFFEAHRQGDARTVLSSVLRGVRYEPHWVRNRGVWSITGRAALKAVCKLQVRSTASIDKLD